MRISPVISLLNQDPFVLHRLPLPPSFLRLPLLLPGVMILLSSCVSPFASSSTTRSTPAPALAPTEPTLAPPQPGSYAALGASETYGVGAEPRTAGYAFLVAHSLRARHFVNVGIPGATINAGYQSELTSALAIRPQLCTVLFGVNDLRAGVTRQSFLQDLHDLVATLRQARAQVLIIGMPELSLVPAVRQSGLTDLSKTSEEWNLGMQMVARETGAHLLDLRRFDAELASHPDYISQDGLHPSNAGYNALAQAVLAAVRQAHLWNGR